MPHIDPDEAMDADLQALAEEAASHESSSSPDPRQFANVDEIRVEHSLHSPTRTTVRIRSRDILEVGAAVYADPVTGELTPHAGDRAGVGQGIPVGVVLEVEHRRLAQEGRTQDGFMLTYLGDEYTALVELASQRNVPIITARQSRPTIVTMDTETAPCQPFSPPAEVGPSQLRDAVAAIRAELYRTIGNSIVGGGLDMAAGPDRTGRSPRPRPVTSDLKSDDPLEDR